MLDSLIAMACLSDILGLFLPLIVVISSLSFASSYKTFIPEGEILNNPLRRARYNELLEEMEERYSKVRLPRMAGKLGEEKEVKLVDGRIVLVKKLSQRPPIYEIGKFLKAEECDHVINVAKKYGLKESKTLDEDEDSDTERMLEMNKFDMWDKDKSGDIEVAEIRHVLEQLLDFDSEENDLVDMIRDFKLDANGDGVVSKEEFTEYNMTRSNAKDFVRRINKIKAEKPTTKGRFSEQTFLSDHEDPLLENLRERLSALTGLPKDLVDASEDLQVVRYSPGGHYNCHLDSEELQPNMAKCCHLGEFSGPVESQCQLCRYMTALYFLNDVEQGGETAFPLADNATLDYESWSEDADSLCNLARNCKKSNVVIKPEKGKAVLWYNHFLRRKSGWLGQVDFRSFHGGCNVQKGEKWIANNWINASPTQMDDFRLWASERLNKEMKTKHAESDKSHESLSSTVNEESESVKDPGYEKGASDTDQSNGVDTRNEL